MSCGKPHATDCREVLDQVYEYLDGELDPRGLERIREHLEECAPCLDQFDLHVAVQRLIRRSCTEHAPAALRERIMLRITEIRLGTSS